MSPLKQIKEGIIISMHRAAVTSHIHQDLSVEETIPSWSIMMTMLYKVSGRVTLKAEGWESDPCLKLQIKTSHFFTVTQTPPASLLPSHNGNRFMLSQNKRALCHFAAPRVKKWGNVIVQFV